MYRRELKDVPDPRIGLLNLLRAHTGFGFEKISEWHSYVFGDQRSAFRDGAFQNLANKPLVRNAAFARSGPYGREQ